MTVDPHDRRERHRRVADQLRAISDNELSALLSAAEPLGSGIGGVRKKIDVDDVPVFVKMMPLTDIEREEANLTSTRDLFGMPLGAHYGVGSPGFGVWREVAANATSTELAIDGDLGCFAAMYHWRVLDGPASAGPLPDELDEIEEYVEYWHGAPGVRRRLDAMTASTAHVALFLEYIPTTLNQWLAEQVGLGDESASKAIDLVEESFLRNIPRMNAAGLFHFDAHFNNLLTDGAQIYLADFGLATSPSFELSEPERAFLDRNASHDLAHTLTRLVDWLVTEFAQAPDPSARDALIVSVAAAGSTTVSMNTSARRVIEQYAPVAAVINEFYGRLHSEDRTAEFPTDAVLEACDRSGLAPPQMP